MHIELYLYSTSYIDGGVTRRGPAQPALAAQDHLGGAALCGGRALCQEVPWITGLGRAAGGIASGKLVNKTNV